MDFFENLCKYKHGKSLCVVTLYVLTIVVQTQISIREKRSPSEPDLAVRCGMIWVGKIMD